MERTILIFKFLFTIFFLIILNNKVQSENFIEGKAKIIDGDTIHIGKNKIRFHGIDAPEIKQTCLINNNIWNCGLESKKALKNFILEKKVNCKIIDTDRYDRFIGVCFVNNKNINKYMVKSGWAIAYRYYSLDYIDDEKKAKINKKGIWKGTFIDPYLYRKKK